MSSSESESDDLARAQAQALGALLERVGYALWQAAECEDTLAHYVVVRLRAKKGIGESAGTALLEKAQQQTFGQLLADLRKAGVLDEKVEARLTPLLKERNWLVHHAKRENRGVLNDLTRYDALVTRVIRIADEATELHKILAADMESFIIAAGVDPRTIDQEADRLMRKWGYYY